MAQRAIEKLEEQFNCIICLDTYTKPKLLQCHHVCCQKCLVRLVKRDEAGQHSLTCPNCRKVTPVPANGVKGLQSAFQIRKIQESVKELKDALFSTDKEAGYCPKHAKKELEFYCETCEELTCSFCLLRGGKHCNHDYKFLPDMAHGCLKELRDDLLPSCQGSLEKLHSELQRVLSQIETIKAATPQGSKNQLELLGDHERFTSCKLNEIHVLKDKLDKEMQKFLVFFKEPVRFSETMTRLLQAHQDLKSFIRTAQKELKQIKVPALLDPLGCYVEGEGLRVAREKEMATLVLHAMCFTGPATEDITKSIECELVSKSDSTKIHCSIKRIEQCQYEVVYQPAVKGRHLLHIRVDHMPIKGSPWHVTVVDRLTKSIGIPVMTLSCVKQPSGIAINREGKIFVSEGEGQRLSVFSSSGAKIQSFGSFHDERNCCRTAIYSDSNENVIYLNCASKVNYMVTADGKTRKKMPSLGDLVRKMPNLVSKAPPRDDNSKAFEADLYAIACYKDELYMCYEVSDLGVLITSDLLFGSRSCTYQKSHPTMKAVGIACDNIGKVYVTNALQHSVRVFTPKLKFLHEFGESRLCLPCGIAIDDHGVVYVLNRGGQFCVLLFTTDGYFITAFGLQGTGPGEFKSPLGIAVDVNQTLYVCDPEQSCVQAFSCKDVHHKAPLLRNPLYRIIFITIWFAILIAALKFYD